MIKYTMNYILYYIDNIVFIEVGNCDKVTTPIIKKVTKDWFMEHCCKWSPSLCSYIPIESKIKDYMESNLTRG